TPDAFRHELARARTFGFMRDVAKLWNQGYALGASFDNTLVVSEPRVLNADGLRYPDEFVRHKTLDALGDLALAGMPLLATYRSVRGGHTLNHAVVSALMADPTAWTMVEAAPTVPQLRGRGGAGGPSPVPAPWPARSVSGPSALWIRAERLDRPSSPPWTSPHSGPNVSLFLELLVGKSRPRGLDGVGVVTT